MPSERDGSQIAISLGLWNEVSMKVVDANIHNFWSALTRMILTKQIIVIEFMLGRAQKVDLAESLEEGEARFVYIEFVHRRRLLRRQFPPKIRRG